MPSAVTLWTDFTANKLRCLAKRARDAKPSRRLISLAAVLHGISHAEAAMIGGMNRQALRDWVHPFDEADLDRQLDNWASGPAPGLSAAQKADRISIVEVGFDRKVDGVVRWRRIELKGVFAEWFDVDYCERYVGMHFRKLGFSHISARPRHRTKDAETGAGSHFLRKPARADSSMTMVRTFIARNARRLLAPAGIQVDAPVA